MNKLLKRVSLVVAGVAILSWGSIAAVQAYTIKPAELRVIVTGLGQRIPGSTVTVDEETGETAQNGQVIFEVAPGVHTVSVEGAFGGKASTTIMLAEDELRQQNFELGLDGALPQKAH